jgi:hypothetical protein
MEASAHHVSAGVKWIRSLTTALDAFEASKKSQVGLTWVKQKRKRSG